MMAGEPRRVVLIVWDGMRPDFVTSELTPVLWRLREQGVWFARHHAVFLSSTEANGTALATGAYPRHSGLIGNFEYRPAIDRRIGEIPGLTPSPQRASIPRCFHR